MNQNNSKRLFIILSLGAVLITAALIIQYKIIEVSAKTVIIPITLEQEGLDFGTVFPGEELEGTVTIQYVKEGQDPDSIEYRIILKRKPLPPGHPELPDGGDPDMPGYYRNLCEHLTAISVEGEGDVKDSASIGVEDPEDVWTIYFKVPAILGNVSQDNQGGVVDSSGEYGCDVSIDILTPLP